MRVAKCALQVAICLAIFSGASNAQGGGEDICREFGEAPSRETGPDNRPVSYVFGRIVLKGLAPGAVVPRVTVLYTDTLQPAKRLNIGRSGNYCFQRRGSVATVVVEVEGVEVARRSISDVVLARQREDFDITMAQSAQAAQPGVISARFNRPPNERTIDLYRRVEEAERASKIDQVIGLLKEIVAIDPEDFFAWTKLGSAQMTKKALGDAEASFRSAVAARGDYTPALLNIGLLAAMRKNFPLAITTYQEAIKRDPASASAYKLLGEAYLQNRQGSLGVPALDKALELDPQGMAECHLLKARLYDLAGAKHLAAAEYKAFLTKVPDHPEKSRFEKYVKDNAQ